MSKIIMFNLISVDGFFAGPNGEIDWHNVDDEFNDFAHEQLDQAGGLIFGRVTYELMANFWPSAAAVSEDPITAKYMNEIPKVVFSRSLKQLDWHNSKLAKSDVVTEINAIKHDEKDWFVFGSGNLSMTLLANNLIDEFRILVNPVILGEGKRLFQMQDKLQLKLLSTREFKNGNVLLIYRPA